LQAKEDEFFDSEYLPDGYTLKDPSKLGRADTKVLLQFWRERQNNGRKAFEFKAFLNKEKDMESVNQSGGSLGQGRGKGKGKEKEWSRVKGQLGKARGNVGAEPNADDGDMDMDPDTDPDTDPSSEPEETDDNGDYDHDDDRRQLKRFVDKRLMTGGMSQPQPRDGQHSQPQPRPIAGSSQPVPRQSISPQPNERASGQQEPRRPISPRLIRGRGQPELRELISPLPARGRRRPEPRDPITSAGVAENRISQAPFADSRPQPRPKGRPRKQPQVHIQAPIRQSLTPPLSLPPATEPHAMRLTRSSTKRKPTEMLKTTGHKKAKK
jgi:hypothetical protein